MKCPICNKKLTLTKTRFAEFAINNYDCPTYIQMNNNTMVSHYHKGGLLDKTYLVFYPYRIWLEPAEDKTYYQIHIPKTETYHWETVATSNLNTVPEALKVLERIKKLTAFT